MAELKIQYLQTSELVPYANNPRDNDKAVEAVAASIKEFGFKVPVVIDHDKVIVCGHTRIKAAKKLGIETVPCVIADDLTEEQIKAFRLADNKTAELADWDDIKLREELDGLTDIDMSAFGFEDILNSEDPNFEEDVQDTDVDVPGSRICLYTCSVFGHTAEKLFEFRLDEEEAEKILARIKELTPEEAAAAIRGLINDI